MWSSVSRFFTNDDVGLLSESFFLRLTRVLDFLCANHGDFLKKTAFAFHGQVEARWGDLCSSLVSLAAPYWIGRGQFLHHSLASPVGVLPTSGIYFYYTFCDWTFEKHPSTVPRVPTLQGAPPYCSWRVNDLERRTHIKQEVGKSEIASCFPILPLSLSPWPGFILRGYFYPVPDPAKPWGSANLTRIRLHLCFLYNLLFLGKGAHHKELHLACSHLSPSHGGASPLLGGLYVGPQAASPGEKPVTILKNQGKTHHFFLGLWGHSIYTFFSCLFSFWGA